MQICAGDRGVGEGWKDSFRFTLNIRNPEKCIPLLLQKRPGNSHMLAYRIVSAILKPMREGGYHPQEFGVIRALENLGDMLGRFEDFRERRADQDRLRTVGPADR